LTSDELERLEALANQWREPIAFDARCLSKERSVELLKLLYSRALINFDLKKLQLKTHHDDECRDAMATWTEGGENRYRNLPSTFQDWTLSRIKFLPYRSTVNDFRIYLYVATMQYFLVKALGSDLPVIIFLFHDVVFTNLMQLPQVETAMSEVVWPALFANFRPTIKIKHYYTIPDPRATSKNTEKK
jgi:hypothetical protein